MSRHRKFSQLTEHFSEERQAAIAEKTAQLKYVSHLRKVIEAMGGELDIITRFPDGEVKIKNFSELIDFSVAPEAGQ